MDPFLKHGPLLVHGPLLEHGLKLELSVLKLESGSAADGADAGLVHAELAVAVAGMTVDPCQVVHVEHVVAVTTVSSGWPT